MLLHLTDLSDEPLQSQIVRQVRAKILSGDLPAEINLPSIRSLARDSKVSVITVQRAYESLEREGLIHARRGKGFFVSQLQSAQKKDMAKQSLEEGIKPLLSAAREEGLSVKEIKAIITKVVKT